MRIDALKMTMSTRNGRRLVCWMFDQIGLMRQPFTGERGLTDFNCGQKNTGYWLFDLIDRHCPQHYLTMLKEAKEDYEYDRQHNPDHNSDINPVTSGSASSSSGGNA